MIAGSCLLVSLGGGYLAKIMKR